MGQYFKICIRIAVAPFRDTDCSGGGEKKNNPQTFPEMNIFLRAIKKNDAATIIVKNWSGLADITHTVWKNKISATHTIFHFLLSSTAPTIAVSHFLNFV